MPFGDGTGPQGLGPGAWGPGRGRGYWSGYSYPIGYGYPGACRRFPWLPRWWWMQPDADLYTQNIPQYFGAQAPTSDQEIEMLKNESTMLKENLKQIEARISELEKGKKKST